jgi:hypothetical protein
VVDYRIIAVDRPLAVGRVRRRRSAPNTLSHIHSISDIYSLGRRDAYRGADAHGGAIGDPGASIAHPVGTQPDSATANVHADTFESNTAAADSYPDAAA